MSHPSASLRQWCPVCQRATTSKPCETCGGQAVTCSVCEGHPGCVGPDEDYDYDGPASDDEADDD